MKTVVNVVVNAVATAVEPPGQTDGISMRWMLRVLNNVAASGVAGPPHPPAPTLPDGVASPPPAQEARSAHTRAAPAVAALRVWVVDDDAAVALYLSELLLDFGFEVCAYTDPNAALEAYRADPDGVDVVITDQRMPRLCGDELARAMLALRPQQRVILCTGYSDSMDRDKAQAMGISGYFKKPFDARALLGALTGPADPLD
jgi:CheY-like chemotaxis protein